MLILTRKPGETVVIDDDVRITVLAIRGSQIKLGIEAPPEVRVNREEVLERDAMGGERAASPERARAQARRSKSSHSQHAATRRPAPHDVPHRRHVSGDASPSDRPQEIRRQGNQRSGRRVERGSRRGGRGSAAA